MVDLDTLCRDGMLLDAHPGSVAGFAFHSLRIGLNAFFSTYQEMRYALHLFEKGEPDEAKDFNTSPGYYDLAAETVLHLHHFTELIIKDLLRTVHPLMADEGATSAVVLKKLLKSEPLDAKEEQGVQSIEFRLALDRIVELIKKGEIGGLGRLDFIANSTDMLQRLNVLRNRLWHRGRFILRYNALDMFVCQHFLPFLSSVLALDRYKSSARVWKYKPLACGFDPLDYLRNRANTYDIGATAFAKELGRAAYRNPICADKAWGRMFDEEVIRRAKAAAESEEAGARGAIGCPVCGIEALVLYDDVETSGEDPETGAYDRAWRYTWQAMCHCCGFEVNHHLKNASAYGIPIQDYWTGEEL